MFGKQKLQFNIAYQHTARTTLATFGLVVLVCAYVISFGLFAGPVQPVEAAIPKYINFQGKLTAVSNGNNVANGSYSFEFKLYDAPSGGSLLWTETWDGSPIQCPQLAVAQGVFNAKLGACEPLTTVDFTGGALYLTVNFNPGAGFDGEMSPRKQLVSSAYSFVANSVSGDGVVNNAIQSATALSTGRTLANPALQVDTNTASSVTGLKVTSAAAGGGLALAAISSGTDENLTIDAKGAGTISIGSSSTGNILLGGGSASTGCTVTNSTGAFACTSAISSGVAGGTIGGYNLSGNTSGTISILPQAAAGTYNFNLPTTAGTSGYVLTSAGGGASPMTWTDPSGLGVRWNAIINPTGTQTLTFDDGELNAWTVSSDTETFQTITANSLTTGTLISASSSSLSSGSLVNLAVSGTAAASNTQKVLNISTSGANATSTQTTYGGYFSNTHTGTASTNVGLYATATGGTNNYAIIVPASGGNVGIGTSTPTNLSGAYFGADQLNPLWVSANDAAKVTAMVIQGNLGEAIQFVDQTGVAEADFGVYTTDLYFVNRQSGGNIRFDTNGSTSMFVASNQRVGIGSGTSVPAAKLEVKGTTGQLSTLIGDAGFGTSYAGLSVHGTFASNSYSLLGDATNLYINRPTGGDISIRENNTTQVTIKTSTGNFGIGDSSPAALLTVGNGDLFQVNSSGAIAASVGITTAGGAVSLNNNSNFATSISTGTNNTLTTIGGGSGTFSLQTTNIDISSAGAITNATGFNGLQITANTGVITTGTWNGSVITGTYGGTGVNNGSNTITIGGNINTASSFTTSGANALTLTTTGATNVTLPTSGTLYGTATGSITSSQLLTSLSDETGSGLAVFGTSPTFSASAIFSGLTASSAVYTDGSKSLTSTAPTSGTIGYWSRTGTLLSPATSGDTLSVPGAGSNSEKFGAGSSAAGNNSVAVGNTASSSGLNAVAVGASATALQSSVAIGLSATNSGINSIAIGESTSSAQSSIVIGRGATTSTTNTLVVGGASDAISNIYFGKGETNASPTAYTINGTGGSGTNIAGAAINIAGGRGTGTGVGGGIVFQYAPAGGSGSSLNTLQTACSISGTNGALSCPGAGSNSERFGAGTTASGAESLAVGYNANSSADYATAVGSASSAALQSTSLGRNANGGYTNSVSLGYNSNAGGNQGVAIGSLATAAGSGIAIGYNSAASGTIAMAIGDSSSASGTFSTAIGYQATANFGNSTAIGLQSVATTSGQFVSGSTNAPISNVYFGNGVVNTSPAAYTINGTGGSGTNIAGADIVFGAGKGTGNAQSGDILFQTSTAGSSGTTLQTLATRMTIDGATGYVGIGTTSPTSKLVVSGGSGNGNIYNDVSSANPNLILAGDTTNGYYPGLDFRPNDSTSAGGSLQSYSSSGGLYFTLRGNAGALRSYNSTNTTTNSIVDQFISSSNSTGTAAANFGTGILLQGESSTTNDQDMARIATYWTTATHATRTSNIGFYTVNSAAALAEKMTIQGDGNVGIGTATPARTLTVVKQDNGTEPIVAAFANNLTQGIGITYNTISAIGSNTNQNISLVPKGTGDIIINSGRTGVAYTPTTGTAVLMVNGGAAIGSNTYLDATVPTNGLIVQGSVGIANTSPSALLTLGTAGTTAGTLSMAGSTSGTITIQPQAAAGTYNFNLPTTAGTSGYVLTSGGGGASPMTWTDPSALGVRWNSIIAPTGNLSLAHGANTTAFTFNSVTTGTAMDFSSTSLTTGKLLQLTPGTSLTTGSALGITGATYNPGAGNSGNLLNLAFTNASSNTTGTSNVAGISIAPTISVAGSGGSQNTYGINIQNAAGTVGAGTQNIYGIYIGNQGRTNADFSYGLYVASQSGSNVNYAAGFGGDVDVSGVLTAASGGGPVLSVNNNDFQATGSSTSKLYLNVNTGKSQLGDIENNGNAVNMTIDDLNSVIEFNNYYSGNGFGGYIDKANGFLAWGDNNSNNTRITVDDGTQYIALGPAGSPTIGLRTTDGSFPITFGEAFGPSVDSTYSIGSSAKKFHIIYGNGLSLGTAATATGNIELSGSTSGTVTIRPQDSAGSYNFLLPTTAGTSGHVLTSGGGASPMTWTDPSGLGVRWNALVAPTGNLSLAHGANTTAFTFNSVTTGTAFGLSSSSLSSGTLFNLAVTGTAAASNTQKALNISTSGANATSAQTTYGGYFANTHTGTSSTNISLYAAASGGTTNKTLELDVSGGTDTKGIQISSPNAAPGSSNHVGIDLDARNLYASTTTLKGLDIIAGIQNFGSGATTVTGIEVDAGSFNNGGTIATAYGINASLGAYNSASITTGSIIRAYAVDAGAATFGTLYGLNLSNWSPLSATTTYGIYMDTSIDQGATRYALYSSATSNSYMAGNLGLGDTSPAALLTVGSGDLFQVASNGNLTSSNAGTWTFSNDTNIALSGGVNGLSFDTDVLSIDATNNRVGIGLTAPLATFHVYDTIQVGSNGASNGFIRSPNNLGFTLDTDNDQSNNYYSFEVHAATIGTGTELMRIQENGNVGIGTSGPSEKLEIGSGGNISLVSGYLLQKANGRTRYYNSANSNYSDIYNPSTGGGAELAIIDGSGTGIRLNGSGNVGIGTTGPDRKLDVLDASNPQLRLTHTDGSVYADMQTDSSGYLNMTATGHRVRVVDNYNGVNNFQVLNSTTGTSASSNVIVGQSTAGDQIFQMTYANTTNSVYGADLGLLTTGTGATGGMLIGTQANASITLATNGLSNPRLTVLGSGNVGIGDATPASLFTVGSGDMFQVNTFGDVFGNQTTLDGSTTSNGAGTSSNTLILTSATNFNIGNYVKVDPTGSNTCSGSTTVCYAKITNISSNTLTISPALTWDNGASVVEVHVPEIGGINLSEPLANRYGRGYFIDGIVTGNGSTNYSDNKINVTSGNFAITGGNVGIGDTTPAALFTVGSGDLLQINSSGLVLAPNGSASNPAFSFVAAPSSGMFYTAGVLGSPNMVSTAIDGTEFLRIQNDNVIEMPQSQAYFVMQSGDMCIGRSAICPTTSPGGNGTLYSNSLDTGNVDVAENYPSKDATLQAGEVVMIDADFAEYIERSDLSMSGKVIGVISTDPGLLLGGIMQDSQYGSDKKYPVALVGRVPVKVTNENGAIEPGDFLTASATIPGAAMRATKAGSVIGQALEGYSVGNNSTVSVGSIITFIKPTDFNGISIEDQLAGLEFDYADIAQTDQTSEQILEFLLAQLPSLDYDNLSQVNTDILIAGAEVVSPNVTTQTLRTDFLSSATSDGGLSVASTTMFNGGLTVDTISAIGDLLSFSSDVEFFGTPYFTSDTAGFAVVKAGVQSVDVVFTREYLAQPIVNASISFEQDVDQDLLDEEAREVLKNDSIAAAQTFLAEGITYVVTNKSKFGFTIVLSKPAPSDVKMSWTALAVRNATTFMSLDTPSGFVAGAGDGDLGSGDGSSGSGSDSGSGDGGTPPASDPPADAPSGDAPSSGDTPSGDGGGEGSGTTP